MVTAWSRSIRAALFGASALLLGACELGSIAIPRSDPELVVHSILNPSDRTQLVLVEQSLTGSISVVDDGAYDPSNPIGSGNGVPVSGAIVQLTDPDGVIMTGSHLVRPNNVPTGIYRIFLDNYSTMTKTMVIQPGRRYSLTVSALGKTVEGSTLVPATIATTVAPRVSFNRDRQSLNLTLRNVPQSRANWVRVEAPIEAYSLFSLGDSIAIAGDVRNIFTENLLRVFYPGFLQMVTVAAVDSNVYDYYRSGNDPFSGTGLITHLTGGLGLFGSVVVVEKRELDVTQDPTGDPLEDRFTRRGGPPPSGTTVSEMRLFLEANGTQGVPDRISGSYLRGAPFANTRAAVYGTRDGNSLDLRLLSANSTSGGQSSFIGTMRGDTLRGTLGGSAATFVRVGK